MNETLQQITFAFAAPLAIAIAFIAPRRRGVDDAERTPRRGWRVVLALGAPVVIAFFALYGWPSEQWQHTVFVPVAGVVIGLVMATTPRTWWWRTTLYVLLGAASVAAVWPVLSRESMAWKLGPALATAVLAAALDPLARRPGPALTGALVMSVGTTAALVLLSGFMKLTLPMVALTVALGTCCILMIWRRWFTLGDGAIAVVAPMLVIPPVVAWLYMVSAGEALPATSFVLAAAASLVLWAGVVPFVRSRSRWVTVPAAWIAVAAICGGAAFLALRPDGAESTDPMEEMYRDMYGAAAVSAPRRS